MHQRVITPCPEDNQVVIGGGVNAPLVGQDRPDTLLQATRPSFAGGDPVQWAVGIENTGSEDREMRVTAVCAEPPAGYEIEEKAQQLDSGGFVRTSTPCSEAGKDVLSGGILHQGAGESDTETRMLSDFPGSSSTGEGILNQWATGILNVGTSSHDLVSYAICSDF